MFGPALYPSLPRHKEVCGATSFLVLANEWKRRGKLDVAKNTVFSAAKTILRSLQGCLARSMQMQESVTLTLILSSMLGMLYVANDRLPQLPQSHRSY